MISINTLESSIQAHLDGLADASKVEIISTPKVDSEFKRPDMKVKITVRFMRFVKPEHRSTDQVNQMIDVEVALECQGRDYEELQDQAAEAVSNAVGFSPSHCRALEFVSYGYVDREDALWTYAAVLKTRTMFGQTGSHPTSPKLVSVEFDNV